MSKCGGWWFCFEFKSALSVEKNVKVRRILMKIEELYLQRFGEKDESHTSLELVVFHVF